MDKNNKISVLELKKLLFDLRDSGSDAYIRFRLMGEMWQTNHSKVLVLTEKEVILSSADNKTTFIVDINTVIQFEVDEAFRQYQPHFHYSVES